MPPDISRARQTLPLSVSPNGAELNGYPSEQITVLTISLPATHPEISMRKQASIPHPMSLFVSASGTLRLRLGFRSEQITASNPPTSEQLSVTYTETSTPEDFSMEQIVVSPNGMVRYGVSLEH